MKINKSTLKQLIREQMELMEDDFDDLNPGKDAAEMAIMVAFRNNEDLPVDKIAKIAVKNLMRSYNITLKDEEKVVMPPEEYERLKMPGLDEANLGMDKPGITESQLTFDANARKALEKEIPIFAMHDARVDAAEENSNRMKSTLKYTLANVPGDLIAKYKQVYDSTLTQAGAAAKKSQQARSDFDRANFGQFIREESLDEVNLEKDELYQKSEIYSKIARNLLVAIKGAIEDGASASALQGVHDKQRAKYKSAARDARGKAEKGGMTPKLTESKLTKESLKNLIKEELTK